MVEIGFTKNHCKTLAKLSTSARIPKSYYEFALASGTYSPAADFACSGNVGLWLTKSSSLRTKKLIPGFLHTINLQLLQYLSICRIPTHSSHNYWVSVPSHYERLRNLIFSLKGIRIPIVSAPMAGASGGALASQVTAGGGFGFIAAGKLIIDPNILPPNLSLVRGYDNPETLGAELLLARSSLQLDDSSQLPIGTGYLGWQLEKKDSPAIELLQLALDNRVKAVWFAFGNELGRWVQYVRDYDKKTRKLEDKTIIFMQICSVQEALIAVNEWKVDVLVAQG